MQISQISLNLTAIQTKAKIHMKKLINFLLVITILILPQLLNAQEKSITLDDAMAVLEEIYGDDYFDKHFWLLAERTEQWEIFVDELPFYTNWGHDCTIYKFPNTGDLTVDLVPEIIKPQPQILPNEEIEPIALFTSVSDVVCGDLENRTQHIWNAIHKISIVSSQLNETDFRTLNKYIYEGRLGYVAFLDLVEFENNAIPDEAFAVETYEEGTPYKCLRKIQLPQNLETIGKDAFNGCDFKDITLPESVKTLGHQSCYNWDNIEWIYSQAVTPPSCEYGETFGGTTPKSTPIYVPIGSAEAYRTAPGWDYFSTFIETDKAPISGINEARISQHKEAKLYWNSGTLNIKLSSGASTGTNFYTVYTTSGTKIAEGTLSGDAVSIPLPHSLYIVKVNNQAYKIR